MAVRLFGNTEYNVKFPPSKAKKGYVARIRGRVSGPNTFDREFLGDDVLVDEPGLYECQTGLKKGGADQDYHVVLEIEDGKFVKSLAIGREDAMVLAKRMDGGESITDMVRLTGRPSKRDESITVYDWEILTKAEAKKAVAGATIASAIEHCWSVINLLPEKEAKKVLAELKLRVSPPKPKADPAAEASAQPSESDAAQ